MPFHAIRSFKIYFSNILSLVVIVFFKDSLAISRCKISQFYFFLSIQMPIILFSHLTDMARTSSSILDTSGENRHPCLVPDPRGEVSSLLPLGMMFVVDFSQMPYCISEVPIYSYFVECYYHEKVLKFVSQFFGSIEMIRWLCSLFY